MVSLRNDRQGVGLTVGDKLALILQTLQGFAMDTFFLQLLRSHLEGLSNEQLAHQLAPVHQVVINIGLANEAFSQIYRLLLGKGDLSNLTEGTAQQRTQILQAADAIETLANGPSGEGHKAEKAGLGHDAAAPLRTACKILEAPHSARDDYQSIWSAVLSGDDWAYMFFPSDSRASEIYTLEGTTMLLNQMQLERIKHSSVLEHHVDACCVTAREEVRRAAYLIIQAAEQLAECQDTQSKALSTVRDLIEFGHHLHDIFLEACDTQISSGETDWQSVQTRFASQMSQLAGMQLQPYFPTNHPQLPMAQSHLTRAVELLGLVLEGIRQPSTLHNDQN